ncbi:MAG TPA: glycosyltransferase [Dissulfurispiraceae bacterium]|nr:glycosyltransferase [Dissulfurispiraceae bacterium]
MVILEVLSGRYQSSYGGGQVYVRDLVEGLIERNAAPVVCSLCFDEVKESRVDRRDVDGVRIYELQIPRRWADCSGEPVWRQARLREMFVAVVREVGPTVVHAHGWKPLAASVCREMGVPCVVTAHHGGIVCPAGALLDSRDRICELATSLEYCPRCCLQGLPGGRLLSRVPMCGSVRSWIHVGEYVRRRRFVPFVTPICTSALQVQNKLHDIAVLRDCVDRHIAPSHAIADALVRNGIPRSKVIVLPHGIPLPPRSPLSGDLEGRPLRFIYVGRINRVKGLHVMLEAFADLPADRSELHIVGAAATRPEQRYERTIRAKYRHVNTKWHGKQTHDAALVLIEQCDVMVHPAIYLEVFGLTIAEALAVGRPVIATRCGGAEMQIKDGINGLLVPPNDAAALRNAIATVLAEPSRIREMADKTDDVVSLQDHVSQVIEVYEEAASRAKTPSRH